MRFLILAVAFAFGASGGTIQGVVIEHASGRPLARSVVRLEPVPGTGHATPIAPARAGRSGQFSFPSVPPGSYLLVAVRTGYFPASYGQRLPAGRGKPIQVTADSALFAELRLRHKGAITGRVLDENGVGSPGVAVLAYRARLPLRSEASGTSDDRGVFRIHGLDPGKYWVRSAAHTLEDNTGWLPTFSPQGREVKDARVYPVTVDAETSYADVTPDSGTLYSVRGEVTCETPGMITVVISSEAGQRNANTYCGSIPGGYGFQGLSPGSYEVVATSQDGLTSGFLDFTINRNMEGVNLNLRPSPAIEIEVRRAGSGGPIEIPVRLTGRRQSLSESGAAAPIMLPRTTLAPGFWEMRAQLPAGYYVESITNSRGASSRRSKPETASDWFEVFIEPRFSSRLRITVSDQAARVSGRVVDEGKPLAGVPVFLWPVAASARRSLAGPGQTLSGADGTFRFDSLPPGDYRVLASFDVNEMDEELAELSRAPAVHAEASRTASIDLPVWVAPY